MAKNKKKNVVNSSKPEPEIKNNTILAVPEDVSKNEEEIIISEELKNSKVEVTESENNLDVKEEEIKQKPEIKSEKILDSEKSTVKPENTDKKISEQPKEVKKVEETKQNNTQDIPINNNNQLIEKKSHKIFIIIPCIIIVLLLLALLLSTGFALFNNGNVNILNGTYIKNTNVSNLPKEEALTKLNTEYKDKLSKVIVIKHNDYETQISLEQLELSYNFNEAIDVAYSKGRSGNIFKDNFDIILSLFSTNTITPSYSYNEEIINSLVKDIEINITDRLIEPSYYIEENNLIISRGKDGYVIDQSALKNNINTIVSDLDNANYTINLPVIFKKVDKIDLNKIHSEVYKTPSNAYFTKDPYVIYPHTDGIDFAISMEEAQNIVNTSTEEEIAIPLTVTSPEITVNDIGDEAFPDDLSSFSTTYSTNNVSRSTNIRLASDKINGTVVMPGEVFSYNATVGQRTTAAGFQTAAVYSGGEVTTGIGGGICQVSTTLYNAVLLANLDIIERQNHGFNPGYVPAGRDATVSWGGPDFKFQNTRNYPIKIICDGAGGTITVDIIGLKEPDEYDVEIESYITRYISYSTITRVDPTLEPGESRVIQSGSSGCASVAYRILYKDGEEISRELLSQDTYSPHNKIVAVGN